MKRVLRDKRGDAYKLDLLHNREVEKGETNSNLGTHVPLPKWDLPICQVIYCQTYRMNQDHYAVCFSFGKIK